MENCRCSLSGEQRPVWCAKPDVRIVCKSLFRKLFVNEQQSTTASRNSILEFCLRNGGYTDVLCASGLRSLSEVALRIVLIELAAPPALITCSSGQMKYSKGVGLVPS